MALGLRRVVCLLAAAVGLVYVQKKKIMGHFGNFHFIKFWVYSFHFLNFEMQNEQIR